MEEEKKDIGIKLTISKPTLTEIKVDTNTTTSQKEEK